MGLNLTLTQKGLLLVSVPLVFEIGFVGYLWGLLEKADLEIKRQEHARQIQGHMNSLTKKLVDAGTTAGSYSCPVFLGNYAEALDTTSVEFKHLEALTSDDPDDSRTVKSIEVLTNQGVELVKQGKALLSKGEVETANELLVNSLKPLVKQLEAETEILTNKAKTDENSGPKQRAEMQNQMRLTLLGGILFNILVAVSLALFFMRSIIRNVRQLMDNSYRLSKRQPLNPPLEGNDEIVHLDRVLRDMAKVLEDANRKERAVFLNARDMICSLNEGGVFSNVSPACVELLGYEPQELDGTWLIEIVDKEDVNRTVEFLKGAMQNQDSRTFDCRVVRKDGRIINVLWSVSWSAQEKSFYCVAHEYTDRKKAEELLRASEQRTRSIIETTPVGIMTLNEAGCIELVNPFVEAMFLCASGDAVGRRITDLLMSDMAPIELLQQSIGKSIKMSARRKSGETFPVVITLREFGENQYLMVLLDITERENMEKLKQEFVAMVSHELRTPLNSVQGFLEVLAAGGYGQITQPARNKTDVAHRNVARLIDLINDILDVEKIEAGKFELRVQEASLQKIVVRSIDAVKDFADKSKVELDINGVDAKIDVDSDRIVQVLINLLSNAIKFSPAESVVRISAYEHQGMAEFRVQDYGPGIAPEYKDSVFERFTQVGGTKHSYAGTGLGLTISKRIIEQHGGTIGVESVEGQGSCFWFRLPSKTGAQKPALTGGGVSSRQPLS